MNDRPFPLANCGSPSFANLSLGQRVSVWSDLVDAGIEMVLAGMRRRTNSEEELQIAFQQWLDRRRTEHDQAMVKMMSVLRQGIKNGS